MEVTSGTVIDNIIKSRWSRDKQGGTVLYEGDHGERTGQDL